MFQTEEIQRVSTGQGKNKKTIMRKMSGKDEEIADLNQQSFEKLYIAKL